MDKLLALRLSLVDSPERSIDVLWKRQDREILRRRSVKSGQSMTPLRNAERRVGVHPVHELISDIL